MWAHLISEGLWERERECVVLPYGKFPFKIFAKLFMNGNNESIIEWIKSSTSVVGDTGTDFKIPNAIISLRGVWNFSQICEEFSDTQQSWESVINGRKWHLPLLNDLNQLCWRRDRQKDYFVIVEVRPTISQHIQSSVYQWWSIQSHMHQPIVFVQVENHRHRPPRHQLSRHRAIHSRVWRFVCRVNQCLSDIHQYSDASSIERSML